MVHAAGFVVRGVVDGRPCVARCSGGELEADPELLRRADVVVAMGERFTTGDGVEVQASTDAGSIPLMLTLMRAFSQVTSVELELPVGAGGAGG